MIIKKIFLIMAVLMLFSSCVVKEKIDTSIKRATYYDYDMKSIIITDKMKKNGSRVYTASSTIETMYTFNINGYMKRELSREIIRKIIKECKTYNYKYFAIVSPKEVSNLDGKLINSVDSFIENFNEYSLKLGRKSVGGWYIYTATMDVSFIMLKERPKEFISWSAN
jgi:hypothetical protein